MESDFSASLLTQSPSDPPPLPIISYPCGAVPDVDLLVPVALQGGQCIRSYFQFPYYLVGGFTHIKEWLEWKQSTEMKIQAKHTCIYHIDL